MNPKLWRGLLLAGLVARIVLGLLTTNSNDLAYYVLAADDGAQRTPIYESASFSYPPLWGYFFALAGRALVSLHVPLIVHAHVLDGFVVPRMNVAYLATPFTALVLKLPSFAVDAALAELLYTCGLARYGRDAAMRLALAWWLNPLPIVVSGVQASWDSAVPFAMIYAIACARQRRWALGGGALAAGVLAKLTPLYLVYLLPALLRGTGDRRAQVRAVAAAVAGAAAVTVVVLWPILVWHELDALRAAVFARTGTFVLGGANLFAFAGLASAQPFNDWASAHRADITLVLSLASIAGCGSIAILAHGRRVVTTDIVFTAAFGLLAMLCLTSPFVQPTYMLWLIPFALFLAAGGDRAWTAIAWTLSGLALAFFMTVRAVTALVEPACVFFRLCNAAHFGADSLRYAYSIGLGGSTLQVSIDVVLGELLCMTLLLATAHSLEILGRPEDVEDAETASARTTPAPALSLAPASGVVRRQAAVAAVVVVVACASAVAPGPAAVRMHVAVDGRRAVVSANGYDGNVHIVVTDTQRPCTEIDAYGDDRYPSLRGVTTTFIAGLPVHLRDDLRRRGLHVPVRLVDADALANVLRAAPGGRCVLLLGGALPQPVRDVDRDLLKPWLLAGGTAFWAGGPFDAVMAHRRSGAGAPLQVVANTWGPLFGNHGVSVFPITANPFAPPVEHAARPVPAWAATRITFDRTTFPLNVGPLVARGGTPLAFLDRKFNSSVSSLPLGRGRLVFFGDAFDDELFAAETVAQLLYSGVWAGPQTERVVTGTLREGSPPITVTGLHGGESVRAFGERYGDGPYAAANVTGQIALTFDARSAVVGSEGYRGDVYADVLPRAGREIRRLLVYRDARYPAGRGTSPELADQLISTLRATGALDARGIAVSAVDADGLRDELRGAPADDALVVLGGVLPDTVRGSGVDLLKPWLESGGTVFWAGGAFDVLHAGPGPAVGDLASDRLDPPDYGPWHELYGAGKPFPARIDPYFPPLARGTRPSPAWNTWRGDFDRTTYALNVGPLAAAGGTPLGFVDARANASVSTLPLGRGRLVFFGDAFPSARSAAENLQLLVLTGAWTGDWRAIAVHAGRLQPGAPPMTVQHVPPGSDVVVFGEPHRDITPFLATAPER